VRRLFLWSLLACVLFAAAPATAATVPLGKARAVAAKRLFSYVWTLTYVTDYDVTGCTTTGGRVSCSYSVTIYGGAGCTGTIVVEPAARGLKARLQGAPCASPQAPVPATTAPPADTSTPAVTTTPSADTTTTPAPAPAPVTTPAPAPAPQPTGPAYAGVGQIHTLDNVTSDGSLVTLDDGSHWQIAASGQAAARTWGWDDIISVAAGSGSTYTLTDNNSSAGSVTATFLG
jgi:hypothetical protein